MVKVKIVFFHLETSGFGSDAEVLQIAMKSGDSVLDEYVMPEYSIPESVTDVNDFSVRRGRLYHGNRKVKTISRELAASWVVQYLQLFDRQCLLVAHNCPFGSSHLLRMIREENLEDLFAEVVYGFTDTLAMFRHAYPERRGKGALKLTTLAEELGLSTEGAHNASTAVELLETIAYHHFRYPDFVDASKSFDDALDAHIRSERRARIKRTLAPLRSIVPKSIITRMASAGVSYEMLTDAFQRDTDDAVTDLLQGRVKGIPTVVWSKRILYDIINHLEEAQDSDY